MNRVDFLLDSDELSPVIKVLQEALINRPNPEGKPHFDLQTALESCDEYFLSIRELTEAAGKLSAHDLLQAANGMSSGYRCLWERHFPRAWKLGNPCFLPFLNGPRDLLRTLQSLTEAESEDYLGEPLITLDASAILPAGRKFSEGNSHFPKRGHESIGVTITKRASLLRCDCQVPFPPSGARHRISAGLDKD